VIQVAIASQSLQVRSAGGRSGSEHAARRRAWRLYVRALMLSLPS